MAVDPELEGYALEQGGFHTGHMDVRGPLGPIYNTLYRSSKGSGSGKGSGKGGSSILATVAGASGSENISPQGYKQSSHYGAPYEYGGEMGDAAKKGKKREEARATIDKQQEQAGQQQEQQQTQAKIKVERDRIYVNKYRNDLVPKKADGSPDQDEMQRRLEECTREAEQTLGITGSGD